MWIICVFRVANIVCFNSCLPTFLGLKGISTAIQIGSINQVNKLSFFQNSAFTIHVCLNSTCLVNSVYQFKLLTKYFAQRNFPSSTIRLISTDVIIGIISLWMFNEINPINFFLLLFEKSISSVRDILTNGETNAYNKCWKWFALNLSANFSCSFTCEKIINRFF